MDISNLLNDRARLGLYDIQTPATAGVGRPWYTYRAGHPFIYFPNHLSRYNTYMPEKTLFSKIIDGEIPSVQLYKDEICVVIMDTFPDTKGKCLVIPQNPVPYIFDLDEDTYIHIMKVARKVAQAIDQALQPKRTCLLVEGFEVPHTHIKLCPAYEEHFSNESGQEASNEELTEVAKKIKKFLNI